MKIKIINVVVAVLVAALVITLGSCSGSGSSSDHSNNTATYSISGVVGDTTNGGSNPVPLVGVTVALRNASHATLSTTTSAVDGTFTIANVPASTDVYVNVSKTNYASFNSEILNLTANLTSKFLPIITQSSAKAVFDIINGTVGGASWGDPFYAGKSLYIIDIKDSFGKSIPGITVTSAPGVTSIQYNNGSDQYISTGPTVTSLNLPVVAGYESSKGIYSFTMTKSSTVKMVKLPLVMGEITYTYFAAFNNIDARIMTQHYYPSNYFIGVSLVGPKFNMISSISATGPNISNQWGNLVVALTTRPTIGDTYVFQINYTDGTHDDLSYVVNGVNDDFATITSPADGGTVATTTPSITWNSASNSTSYQVMVVDGSTEEWIWSVAVSSGTNSVVYNFDGKATAPLQSGKNYLLVVHSFDSNGNQSTKTLSFSVL